MPKGPRFPKASYAMFAVAVMMAALKLGGFLDADPLFLKTVPANQVAKTSEPEVRRQAEEREAPDLHRLAEGPILGPSERPFTGSLTGFNGQETEAPIFYRSSSVDFNGPVCGDIGSSPRSRRAVFPLPEEYFNSYNDTWGAARP